MKIKTYTKRMKELKEWAEKPPEISLPSRRDYVKAMASIAALPTIQKYVKPKKMESKVFVIQEISGTRYGAPKINIMGASKYGEFVFCLPEMSQMIFSPGPLIFKLRDKLKHYTAEDYLLLTGDPAIIGVACSMVSDITNGKNKLLKWDKQERKYYPIQINLHERGNTDE